MKKIPPYKIVTTAIILLLLVLTFNIAQSEMITTGAENHTAASFIKHIYNGLVQKVGNYIFWTKYILNGF
ncbi:hypothetical protein CON36_32555 [Bacillus cereus]|uniref:Uncharacterized protein n=2 Tax=Bacillus cereus group TaxID=86661 RepID=A0A9X6XVC3_BACCE|nr:MULTISPECIES: hypothetical protein [Bacillus cereus group]PDZ94670.1 hypothetical protein CON36_32555 [Bacillus cereus]PFJ28937.1 hypothetical protein COJ15_32220 [Bacillus thuringiensis]PGP14539.1 hypothetical protein COA01_29695 [Bacillus cereus]